MTQTAKHSTVKNLISAGVCMALCILLPFLTGQIPQIGSMLTPMHLPVLLCGFICGCQYGLAVGFVAPVLRSMLFGMPPMFPVALCMAFEMAVYGLAAGLLIRALPKKVWAIYASLLISMLAGRIVWGGAAYLFFGLSGQPFTINIFIASVFVKAVPGIIAQILLLPPLVLAAQKAGLMPAYRPAST